ncbi:MAG TPA: MFS transporter [Bryobacteraceae bacterium]|nr:MFS transporter [Bryobacteraceae bacterium]
MSRAGEEAGKATDRAVVASGSARSGRWLVLAFLVGITVINFIDRQTLSVLAPKIRELLHLSHEAYGRIVAAFQFGMMSGEFPMGWLMDRWGVRLGLGFAVLWWSVATGLHGFARSGFDLALLRFWMGTGECGNFSGGVKTVNEWFPRTERALAIGIFNSGTMIGSIIAPPLVVFLARHYGYRYAFLVPAILGACWVPLWWRYYGAISKLNPWHTNSAGKSSFRKRSWALLRYRQSWAIMACRFLVGPVLQFYWYWMPDYLYTVRGLSLRDIGAFSWIPFLMGDLGSISGGWAAGLLLRRNFSAKQARQITMYGGALLCLASFAVYFVPTVPEALGVIGIVLFGHTFLSANMFASVTDMFPDNAVGRATGLHGICGGLSGFLFPLLTGFLVDRFSYSPVFALAAVMPLAGTIALFTVSKGLQPVSLTNNDSLRGSTN